MGRYPLFATHGSLPKGGGPSMTYLWRSPVDPSSSGAGSRMELPQLRGLSDVVRLLHKLLE